MLIAFQIVFEFLLMKFNKFSLSMWVRTIASMAHDTYMDTPADQIDTLENKEERLSVLWKSSWYPTHQGTPGLAVCHGRTLLQSSQNHIIKGYIAILAQVFACSKATSSAFAGFCWIKGYILRQS